MILIVNVNIIQTMNLLKYVIDQKIHAKHLNF
jgi:hypothetical protein